MVSKRKHKSPPAIIAILAMNDDLKPFRGNSQNFIDLIETAKRKGMKLYVVTPRDLNVTATQITSYSYDSKKQDWVQQTIPLPKVIYNRVPYRRDENDPEVQQVINQCLRNPRILFFNPAFFNKWVLFNRLRTSKKTKKFVPHTEQWSEMIELAPLLEKYPFLYLKPESGKAGSGIMRIRKTARKDQPYLLSIQAKKDSEILRYQSEYGLRNKLIQLIGDKSYIVQQGIDLTRYQKRPFDLRVLVQKNHKGLWTFTGVGARVAGKKSITTHVPRGGYIDDPQKLLTSAYGRNRTQRLMRSIERDSILIAKQIESRGKYLLGEMSIDLGVDNAGRIWFFEANAKPMKFDEPHIREKSLKRIIQFCSYLARRDGSSNLIQKSR